MKAAEEEDGNEGGEEVVLVAEEDDGDEEDRWWRTWRCWCAAGEDAEDDEVGAAPVTGVEGEGGGGRCNTLLCSIYGQKWVVSIKKWVCSRSPHPLAVLPVDMGKWVVRPGTSYLARKSLLYIPHIFATFLRAVLSPKWQDTKLSFFPLIFSFSSPPASPAPSAASCLLARARARRRPRPSNPSVRGVMTS